MKRLNQLLTLLSIITGIFLGGCTDDMPLPVNEQEKIPEGITLRIPDAGLAASLTRSEASLTTSEKIISSLYLVAFHADQSPVVENLLASEKVTETTSSENSSDGFRSFDISKIFEVGDDGSLVTGNWSIYVMANIDPYLKDASSLSNATISSEEELKKLKLQFIDDKGNYLLMTQGSSKGLPSLCLAKDLVIKSEKNGTSTGDLNLERTTNAVLHADLKFLVSKVRYTILFNSEDGQFSNNVFAGSSWNLENVIAKNIYKVPYQLDGTMLDGDVKDMQITTPHVAYPADNLFPYTSDTMPESYNDVYDFTGTDLGGVSVSDPPYSKRAYQATLYFPANTGGKQTELAISAKEQHKTDVADGADLSYSMLLLPGEHGRLQPSNAYDIVAKVTGVNELESIVQVVSDWTPRDMVYSLMPPTFLKVDHTEVEIVAGERTEIGYETNAQDGVRLEGPTISVNGKDVQLYVIEKDEDGVLYIGVNSEIPESEHKHINTQGEDMLQFYLVAGNIRKKIDVSELTIRRFLTVDPTLPITIDARERLGSGEYDGEITVTIRTNLSSFKLSTENWGSVTNGKTSCLKITNKETGRILWSSKQNDNDEIIMNAGSDFKDGKMELIIRFADLNKDQETFWGSQKSVSFVVSCDNEGYDITDPNYIGAREVRVNILPNTDKYTIYFRADDGWLDPHAYIYQCLELPMNTGKYTFGDREYNLASYPVGYYNSKNRDGGNAALEYLFSGSVMFKGWDHADNRSFLSSSRISSGHVDHGFFMYGNDYSDDNDHVKTEWDASNDNSTHYFRNVDFNADIRPTLSCQNCRENGPNNGWPGIEMKPAEDGDPVTGSGWWKLELSGLATPGKCLLMFKDCHVDDNNNKKRRYPQGYRNGVALFDYANRTGYIELTKIGEDPDDGDTHVYNCSISNTQGGVSASGAWFTNDGNWENVYAYVWKEDSNGNVFKYCGDWPGKKLEKDRTGNYYLDITDGSYQKIIFNNGLRTDDGDAAKQTGGFDLVLGKTYSTSGSSGGDVSHDTFRNGSGYLINFSGSKNLWMWLTNNGNTVQEITKTGDYNWDNWPIGNNGYYFVASVDGADKLNMYFGSMSDYREIPASSFKWNASQSRYEYTLE